VSGRRDLALCEDHRSALHVDHHPPAISDLAHNTLTEGGLHRVAWCES
jgi:hypothetical protein